jgi:gliding motility-associated-like protein
MFKTFENFETYARALFRVINGGLKYLFLLWVFMSSGLAVAQSGGFVENKGQWPSVATHKLALPSGDFWLERTGWSVSWMDPMQREYALHALHHSVVDSNELNVNGHVLKVNWLYANALPDIQHFDSSKAYFNYFIGNDPNHWATKTRAYQSVEMLGVYRGIDVIVEQSGQWPKITYRVEPDAEPNSIVLHYQGARSIMADGKRLHVGTSIGDLVEEDLMAYQNIDGKRVIVPCEFIVWDDHKVGFELGEYDRTRTLFIDPTVIASTNSGCTSEAFGHTATFNEAGHIYSGGRCFGAGYPTDSGAFQVNFGGPFTGSYYLKVDMCLSKYNQNGSDLIYATYLGGNGEDLPHSMIANSQDHIVLLGSTNSTDYPFSTGAFDETHNGAKDIVITSLSSDGTQLVGSTYLGGSGGDGVNNLEEYYADAYRGELIIDSNDNIYIASFSRSNNFPVTTGCFQDSLSGQQDGVVLSLTPNLDSLRWSTYLGGVTNDAAFALKRDSDGNVFVAGATTSASFPTDSNSAYPTYLGGQTDAFITKLNPNGNTMLAGSFFGTSSGDQNYFVELDGDGGVYIFGTSGGGISASTGKYSGPATGGYVYKTNSVLDAIEWITSFGNLAPAAFLVDNCSRIYISGQGATNSILNINSFDTLDPVNNLNQAGFYLMKLSPDANELEFGSFYGNNGSHVDGGTSRFDKRGVVYQATCSNGTFPTTSWAYSTTNQTNNATYDNTVFKIDFESNVAKAEIVPGDTACAPFLAVFENEGSVGTVHYWDFGDGSFSIDSAPTHLYDSVGSYEIFYVISDSQGCYGDDTAFMTLEILEAVIPEIEIGDTTCVDSVLLSVDTTNFQSFQWSTGSQDPSIFIYSEGQYSVSALANLHCINHDTVDITFLEAYNFTLNDTGICEVGFPVFGPANSVSYLWSTGDTTRSTMITETGIYTLTASNGECEQAEEMNVDVSFVEFDTHDTVTCLDTFYLQVDHAGGDILWSTNQTTPVIGAYESGTYWVTISNGFCISSDTIDLEFNPELISLGNDTVACGPFQIQLDDSYDTYLWSTGDFGSTLQIDSSMKIWVIVGNAECVDRDTVDIEIQSLALDVTDVVACDLDSIELGAPDYPKADYHWSNGDTLQQTWAFESGNYWVNMRTPHCQKIDTLSLRFVSTPPFSLGPDTAMCVGEILTIPMDTNYSRPIWSTGDTGTSVVLQNGGELWAAQEFDGCLRYDTIVVDLRQLNTDSFAMVNNIMTPNGDGLNDYLEFSIQEESLVLNYHLLVYDRWGIRVFESETMGERWDGIRPSGKPADDGVFFYLLRVETVCVQKPVLEIKDNVTLIK